MHDVCPGERVCRGCECGQVRRVCQGRECGQDRRVCRVCPRPLLAVHCSFWSFGGSARVCGNAHVLASQFTLICEDAVKVFLSLWKCRFTYLF